VNTSVNKNSIFQIILVCLILAIASPSFSQVIQKNTWSAGAGGIHLRSANLYIQQVIGQASVSGTFKNPYTLTHQGFLQGSPISTVLEKPLEVIAFPNPFEERIHFRFSIPLSQEVILKLVDAQGKQVYRTNKLLSDKTLSLQLTELSAGLYIAYLQSGNRTFVLRIVKK
jgi:hypothetical protein